MISNNSPRGQVLEAENGHGRAATDTDTDADAKRPTFFRDMNANNDGD